MSFQNSKILIRPYRYGFNANGRMMLNAQGSEHYLSLSTEEVMILRDLQQKKPLINDFLIDHLDGKKGLNIQDAADFLIRLIKNDFVDSKNHQIEKRVESFSKKIANSHESKLSRAYNKFLKYLNYPLMSFHKISPSPLLARIGDLLLRKKTMMGILSATFILAIISPFHHQISLQSILHMPENLIFLALPLATLVSSFLAIIRCCCMAGAGCKQIRGHIILTAGCIIRFQCIDDEAVMMSRENYIRYHVFNLASPWLLGLLSWLIYDLISDNSNLVMLGFICVLQGIMQLCPLLNSSFVRLIESITARNDTLFYSHHYTARRIFKNLLNKGGSEVNSRFELSLISLACMTKIWLYSVWLLLLNQTWEALPDLIVSITHAQSLSEQFSAVSILILLAVCLVWPSIALILIPLSNIMSSSKVPFHRVRQKFHSADSKHSDIKKSKSAFLSEVPLFSFIPSDQLNQLASKFQIKQYKRGESIILQGSTGDYFYVLATGQVQIIKDEMGQKKMIDKLLPGDSFGELALLSSGKRQASVTCVKSSVVLALHKKDFHQLFPENSPLRNKLTSMMRRIKLIMDSQALSHLSPKQVFSLAQTLRVEYFNTDQKIISQGEIGQSAYIIAKGKVSIRVNRIEIAKATRGKLIGAIAVVRQVPRTADIVALTPVTCAKIDRKTFIKTCIDNIQVAVLVSQLNTNQLEKIA